MHSIVTKSSHVSTIIMTVGLSRLSLKLLAVLAIQANSANGQLWVSPSIVEQCCFSFLPHYLNICVLIQHVHTVFLCHIQTDRHVLHAAR